MHGGVAQMKLLDLKPQFVRHLMRDGQRLMGYVESIDEADGVRFLCPACFATNGGPVGTHSVVCWRRGRVPEELAPGPGRWEITGTGLENLTLSPSVDISAGGRGCGWHGWIRDGTVT